MLVGSVKVLQMGKNNRCFDVYSNKRLIFAPAFRACGEIGRRARLRIWCSDTCRFESYQAHNETKEEFSR